jgi:hypothetical protein
MKHRALIPIESRLEGGVNRAKLKFTKLITTTSRVSVRNNNESEREGTKNKSQANKECDMQICFTEVRFLQTYSPLRWSQRPGLFQPFPSLKRSLGSSELFFSINWKTKFPQGPPHDWCLLPQLQVSLIARKNEKEGSNPCARAQKNTTNLSH